MTKTLRIENNNRLRMNVSEKKKSFINWLLRCFCDRMYFQILSFSFVNGGHNVLYLLSLLSTDEGPSSVGSSGGSCAKKFFRPFSRWTRKLLFFIDLVLVEL